MGRIYQNEKVLMREVGLIKTAKLVVTKEETLDFEGTEKEIKAHCWKLSKEPNVVRVEGYVKN